MAKSRAVQLYINGKDRTKKMFRSVRGGIKSLTKTVFSLKGALVALGGVAVAKSFIDTASDFEDLEVSLTTVTGSLNNAREAMKYANKEAAKSPYTVKQYAEAIKTLSAYGIDYKKNLKTLGDTAAAMGKPLQQSVEAFADAMQGEGERLKDFGIKQSVAGDKITYTWVDTYGKVRKTVAKNSPIIIADTLRAIWNEKYAGGMEKFSKTWTGLTSTAESNWEQFQKKVMDAGLFDILKGALDELNSKFNESGEDVDALAEKIGKDLLNGMKTFVIGSADVADQMVPVVSSLKDALGDVWAGFNKLPSWAQEVGVVGAFLGGSKGKALILGAALLTNSLSNIGEAFEKISSGEMKFGDLAFSNAQQLEEKLDKIRAKNKETDSTSNQDDSGSSGKFKAAAEALFQRIEARAAETKAAEKAAETKAAESAAAQKKLAEETDKSSAAHISASKKAVEVEKEKAIAADLTTAAYNRQFEAARRMNAELLRGKSGGTYSTSVEKLAQDLDDEADK